MGSIPAGCNPNQTMLLPGIFRCKNPELDIFPVMYSKTSKTHRFIIILYIQYCTLPGTAEVLEQRHLVLSAEIRELHMLYPEIF